MKTINLFTAAILLTLSAFSQPTHRFNWDEDIDYLSKELPARHYDLFSVKSEAVFASGLTDIKSAMDSMSPYEVALRLQQHIALFGDSHTQLVLGELIDGDKVLPLYLYWFSDGLYIIHTTPENSIILGKKIKAVNGVPLETIVDSLSTLISVDNHAQIKKIVPRLLPQMQNLSAFGIAEGGSVELSLQDAAGNLTGYTIAPSVLKRDNRRSVPVDSLAFCVRNENVFYAESYFANERIYYLQYNRCWSRELEMKYGNKNKARELPSFGEFQKTVFNTLKHSRVDKIIFDMRYNGGGSSLQGTEFIEKLSRYISKHPHIKVYVVIGRDTFSSAILNAMDFKKIPEVIFVGEETAGKPNHFGEVRSFRLPVSGLMVNYSTKYFKNVSEDVKTIVPDVQIETTFTDFKSGVDPVYEWISQQ